jgi:hypothetical protein
LFALSRSRESLVRYFVNRRVSVETMPPIMLAAKAGHVGMVDYLISVGESVELMVS